QDAGPWMTAAMLPMDAPVRSAPPSERIPLTHTALIDQEHLVSKLYSMVNVPTAVWINEQGRIVRPNETAYVDDRLKHIHGLESALAGWIRQVYFGPNYSFASANTLQGKAKIPEILHHRLEVEVPQYCAHLYSHGFQSAPRCDRRPRRTGNRNAGTGVFS